MRLDDDTAKRLRINTAGMEPFNILRYPVMAMRTGLYDPLRSTRFFRGDGKIFHHYQGRANAYDYMYFVQRDDGRLFVGSASGGVVYYDAVKKHLAADVKADVIVCQVPAEKVNSFGQRYLNVEYGPLEFLACHHPSHSARVKAIQLLMRRAAAEANETPAEAVS